MIEFEASANILKLVEIILNRASSFFKKNLVNYHQLKGDIQHQLVNHITEVDKWAFYTQEPVFASKKKDVVNSTIELSLSEDLYSSKIQKTIEINEKYILNSDSNFVIYGDPGSGKTTTLKRLAKQAIENWNGEVDYNFPICIRLRDLKNDSLVYKVAEILGFKIDSHHEEVVETVELKIDEYNKNEKENELIRQGIYFTTTPIFNIKKINNEENRISDLPVTGNNNLEIQYYLIKFNLVKKKQKFRISDIDAIQFVTQFFNETKPIVFIDGLDEIKNTYKENILEEIEFMGSKSRSFKIILTSRFGESISNLTGFNTCRILSLNNSQVDGIIKIFSDEPDKFKNHLVNKPYSHILNRPLFLTYLIAFFNREGHLPSRHIDVYRNIIDLVTKAWDITRSERIKRDSRYNFWSIEKEEFLAELAFELTYEGDHFNFSESFFKEKFYNLSDKYDLPKNQMAEIFNEIQSHTGLIVKSFNHYSFCHPCLQEYLCALHMRHSPISEVWYFYFDEYPEILAVATSLSQASDAFIAEIFLSDIRERVSKSYNPSMVNRFLQRLFIENPKFKGSIELGFTALYLSYHYLNLPETEKSIKDFLNKDKVKNSIKLINQYYFTRFDGSYVYLERKGLKGREDSQYRITPPQNSLLYKEYYYSCCD